MYANIILKKPYTREVIEDISCGYLMFLISAFDGIGNKHDIYRGKDCMKNVL